MILIGLGNPGKKYASTRHNAGRMLVRWLREEGRGKREEIGKKLTGFEMVETDCFMNDSGEWIKNKMAAMAEMAKMVKSHESPNHSSHSNCFNHLFIAHDDLDLALGSFKIHFGKGPQLHKGILSIEQALGTKDFWRIRIGVDNREEGRGKREEGEDYVLKPFKRDEKRILLDAFSRIRDEMVLCIQNNNRYLQEICL